MSDSGFSKIQKKEISEIVADSVSEVMRPFMDVEQDRWDRNNTRLDSMSEDMEHVKRMMNAHTADLHNVSQKLDAFIDKSVQQDEKLTDHEKRITSLETAVAV